MLPASEPINQPLSPSPNFPGPLDIGKNRECGRFDDEHNISIVVDIVNVWSIIPLEKR